MNLIRWLSFELVDGFENTGGGSLELVCGGSLYLTGGGSFELSVELVVRRELELVVELLLVCGVCGLTFLNLIRGFHAPSSSRSSCVSS